MVEQNSKIIDKSPNRSFITESKNIEDINSKLIESNKIYLEPQQSKIFSNFKYLC